MFPRKYEILRSPINCSYKNELKNVQHIFRKQKNSSWQYSRVAMNFCPQTPIIWEKFLEKFSTSLNGCKTYHTFDPFALIPKRIQDFCFWQSAICYDIVKFILHLWQRRVHCVKYNTVNNKLYSLFYVPRFKFTIKNVMIMEKQNISFCVAPIISHFPLKICIIVFKGDVCVTTGTRERIGQL